MWTANVEFSAVEGPQPSSTNLTEGDGMEDKPSTRLRLVLAAITGTIAGIARAITDWILDTFVG